MSAPVDYQQHLEVETPEHVVLDYEVAGVGSRTLAAAIDWGIIAAVVIASMVSMSITSRWLHWASVIQIFLVYTAILGYFALFEGLRRGQTPGKRAMGVRVIRDTGHAVTLSDAAARNLMFPIDVIGCVGPIMMMLHPRAKRLGDLVAGTVVVRDRPVLVDAVPIDAETLDSEVLRTPELMDAEFRLLREFVQRSASLPASVRERLARDQTLRLAPRYPQRPADDIAFLRWLHGEESARRRGRLGTRSRVGASGASVAERLVARKAARWQEFQQIAERVTRQGLDSLSAHELPDFAARYREVAADLARARTYRADPVTRARLERLVASGHNALYREERRTWRGLWRFFAFDAPASVVRQWRVVALATGVFVAPAVAGYAALRAHPELAPAVLPDVMLERAEAGLQRQATSRGYVEVSTDQRPVMASSIIGNNVMVAFRCFAGGIALGIGSLVMLAFNGLQLGAVSAHFANSGLLGYLWTFVISHGVLELFAIWVAGAAGFLLGRAVIAPGNLTRQDAITLAGREAMRMIGAVVVLLLIAGSIEGMISAGGSSVATRLSVSAATAIFLGLYLWNGARQSTTVSAIPAL